MLHASRKYIMHFYIYPWCEFDAISDVFCISPSADTRSAYFGSCPNFDTEMLEDRKNCQLPASKATAHLQEIRK